MGLVTHVVLIAIHMVLIGLDILTFFVLCRIVSYRWHPNWLRAINSSGKPVVNWITATARGGARYFRKSYLSERELLLLGTLLLMLVRLLLAAFLGV